MSELGQALRDARNEKGMSLQDVQGATKIQKRYLSAIEAGDFSQLPGEFYTRAFIKNYAESVGLDPQELFTEYTREIPKARQEPVDVDLASGTRIQRSKERKRKAPKPVKHNGPMFVSFLPKIIIIIALIAVLVGIYMVAIYISSNRSESTANQPENKSEISYKKDGNHKAAANDQKDQNKKEAKKKDEQKKQTDKRPSLTLDKTEGSSSYYTLAKTDQFKVNISAKPGTQTWIGAENSKAGKKYAFGLAQDDKDFNFDASDAKQISIRIGNTHNTVMTINGETFDFPNDTTTQNIYITFDKQ
ncbi:cytoskeletal protein RodZ [Scopulibacillus darangshiensis]|uniref:Cytoskeletal protein RodZ n=1 Tax=Scopulibacillus darangshiensis TaxID=442528 RepID=A0A4R2P8T3_9BACL|nr:helix-turn-helix domain-containing protein [Scopulibacillus darangshiensis]TCP30265.1 cytoskeletal protein RodZ [Scopulibacillus darangshiensis]